MSLINFDLDDDFYISNNNNDTSELNDAIFKKNMRKLKSGQLGGGKRSSSSSSSSSDLADAKVVSSSQYGKSTNLKPRPDLNDEKTILIKKTTKKPQISKGDSYAAELNANKIEAAIQESISFSDKLREMRDENGRLRKLLGEKDYEINQIRKKMNEERDAIGSTIGSLTTDVAATKIVELAKKNRELTAQLESEKTRNKQLLKSNHDLESKLNKLEKQASKGGKLQQKDLNEDEYDSDGGDIDDAEKLAKENKELKEKLMQVSQRMTEYKSQAEILKQELKKTQKALEKEVGDQVDIKTILSGNSNWRGRQQQIRMLQSKVADLKQQVGAAMDEQRTSQMLNMMDDEIGGGFSEADTTKQDVCKSAAQASTFSGACSSSFRTQSTKTDLHHRELRRLEKDKRERNERMQKEVEAIESDYNALKEKSEGLKARNKILSDEVKTMKEQTKTLLEKAKHDDELVDALMKKQNQLKDTIETQQKENDKLLKDLSEKNREMQQKSMQDKNTIDQLKTIVADRETKLKQMDHELNNQRAHSAMNSSAFLLSGFDDPIPKHSNSNKSANNDLLPTETTSTTPSQLDREMASSRHSIRNNKSATLKSSSSNKMNGSSLNASEIEAKKEQNVDLRAENRELRTLNKSGEIERVRLLDLVKTLQKRIEDLTDKGIEYENQLNSQRRKCVELEKQLEKSKLSDSKSSAQNNKFSKTATSSNAANAAAAMDQYKLEELETSLLIQKDENDALKAALKSTLEAKEEDLRLYVEMLESTKRVFLDGLKQFKRSQET